MPETRVESRWEDDLLALIRATDHLCLQVDDPGWENARGYLFDEPAMALYFPVAKKYLTVPLSDYEVIIWSRPCVVVRGELQPATSDEDTAAQLRLARAGGLDENAARYMLLDQRTQKTRRTRYKLIVRDIARANALGGGSGSAGDVWRVSAMGTNPNMLGTFFEASGSLAVAEIASGPVERSPTADVNGLTEVALGTLGEILGVGGADDLADRIGADGFEADHGEAGVFALPNEFRDALVALIDLDGVSARWTETEELAADHWQAVDTRDALERMRTVAQAAREAGNPLYYWWSL